SEVARQVDDPDVRVGAVQRQHHLERIVRRAVVDEQDLVIVRHPQRGLRRPPVEFPDVGRRVVERRDDRQLHWRRMTCSRAAGPTENRTSTTLTACSKGGYNCAYSL